MKSSLPFLLLVSAALAPDAAEAQAPDSTNKHAPIVLCRAARVTEKISVDGKLDEHVWSNGNAITDFKQRDPNEGTAPSQKTEVRVAYDDEAVYVGARMYDSAPDSILARLSRRDVSVPADRFSFYLDPLRADTGAIRMIPGTNHYLTNFAGTLVRTLQQPEDIEHTYGVRWDEIPSYVVETDPGDLVVWSFRTIHASFGGDARRRLFSMSFREPLPAG